MFPEIKKATVALVHATLDRTANNPENMPYTIHGTGFCIDPRGVIVTARHVMESFMSQSSVDSIASTAEVGDAEGTHHTQIEQVTPFAVIPMGQVGPTHTGFAMITPDIGMGLTDCDLGMMRLRPHGAFPDGYPYVPLAEFNELVEAIEVGTCGFPLGNDLQTHFGTITSSFSRGILSAIIPVPECDEENVQGFQLNLNSNPGNSGGPVFSWDTGRVFGVLVSGLERAGASTGLTKAEPIWKVDRFGAIEKLASAPPNPTTPQDLDRILR